MLAYVVFMFIENRFAFTNGNIIINKCFRSCIFIAFCKLILPLAYKCLISVYLRISLFKGI
jgi:hypothetical protein